MTATVGTTGVVADSGRTAIEPPFIRSAYNYDAKAASDAAVVDPATYGPSLAVQSMRDDNDLTVLMQRMGVTGQMPQTLRIPEYGDFSEITDFHSALEAVRKAEAAFNSVPAEIRSYFSNSPQAFLDFCSNPANLPQMVSMGLAKENAGGGYKVGIGSASKAVGGDSAASAAGNGGDSAAAGSGKGSAG